MPKTFFTADSHYGHSNIVKSLSKWSDLSATRDFPSLSAMNDALVKGINSVVRPDDTLYHVGDFNFGGLKNLREFRSRLNCENIHLILGNHDFNHGSVNPTSIDHGFASIQPYKEIIVNGQEIVLCHYALRVWNRQGNGAWHLYGHSHGTLENAGNFSMDVGVDHEDGTFDPVPYSFEDIQRIFSTHSRRTDDHHSVRTNSPRIKG